MKAESTIRRELRKVREAKGRSSGDSRVALYGAEQALSWALGLDAAAPSVFDDRPPVRFASCPVPPA